ncbi:hypothetical protein Q7P37_006886 [Cladosporium fusiforme]
MFSRLRTGIQSLSKSHSLAATGHAEKRALSLRPGSLSTSRIASPNPSALRTHFFAAKRPQRAPMDRYQVLSSYMYGTTRQLHRTRFASTKRAVQVIISLNVVVFGAWTYARLNKDRRLQRYLDENALLTWANVNANRYWTLVTSAFSHQNFMHLLFNMIVLDAFSSAFVCAGGIGIGVAHVAGLTLGSAAAGSLAFLWYRNNKRSSISGSNALSSPVVSHAALGASGVAMSFAAAATCLAPWQPMLLMGIVKLPMWALTALYFGIDLGFLGSNDGIGHEAHIGGAVSGLLYYGFFLRRYGGISQLLRKR